MKLKLSFVVSHYCYVSLYFYYNKCAKSGDMIIFDISPGISPVAATIARNQASPNPCCQVLIGFVTSIIIDKIMGKIIPAGRTSQILLCGHTKCRVR